MVIEDFPELVETARHKTNDICEKSKLILKKLLPHIKQLQKESTHFSPRLMLLMLKQSREQLSRPDFESFQTVKNSRLSDVSKQNPYGKIYRIGYHAKL